MFDSAPSIVIFKNHALKEDGLIEKICWGIEEEGLPVEIQWDEEADPIRLSYQAAHASRLNVGIGIGSDGSVAVHDSRMKEDTPVFMKNGTEGSDCALIMGMNAARLVKGLPFKGFENL